MCIFGRGMRAVLTTYSTEVGVLVFPSPTIYEYEIFLKSIINTLPMVDENPIAAPVCFTMKAYSHNPITRRMQYVIFPRY